MKISISIWPILLASLTLIGCGWVDSTGNQGGSSSTAADSAPSSPTSGTAPSGNTLEGGDLLQDRGAVSVNEASTSRFILADAPSNAGSWTWRAVTSDEALPTCNSLGGFDAEIATTSLSRACADESNCDFIIQEFDNNGRTEFNVTLPVLSAPVALTFSLETTLESGELHTQEQTVCAAAINEAPEINDNVYRTLASETRIVSATADDAIFSNDSDDEHVRNVPLFIKEVTSAPLYAETITVNSDGSFQYKAVETLELSTGESLEDRIDIIVSDGVHEVESAIRMNIVTSNVGPTLQLRVPNFILTPTDRTSAELSESLALYFSDADGDDLQYRLVDNEFTDAGLLSLNDNGTLNGRFSMEDIGTVAVTVLVSDGLEQIADRFNIIVQANQTPNRAPTVSDISNERVSGLFSYDVSEFFTDADGDTLTFTSDNLPPGLSLSESGLLTGAATEDNDGRWFITVTASDNRGGTVDDSFRLIILN